MKDKNRKNRSKYPHKGQGMIEYILVFVAVVVIILAAVGPGGIFGTRLIESLEKAATGIDCMAQKECYDPAGCPPLPANCP